MDVRMVKMTQLLGIIVRVVYDSMAGNKELPVAVPDRGGLPSRDIYEEGSCAT